MGNVLDVSASRAMPPAIAYKEEAGVKEADPLIAVTNKDEGIYCAA